jgi:hypothetical protein
VPSPRTRRWKSAPCRDGPSPARTPDQIQLTAEYLRPRGSGYLRLLRFSSAERRVTVQTYSPFLDRFKMDPDNDFTLDY